MFQRAPRAGVELGAGPELHRRRHREEEVVDPEGERVLDPRDRHRGHHHRSDTQAEYDFQPERPQVGRPVFPRVVGHDARHREAGVLQDGAQTGRGGDAGHELDGGRPTFEVHRRGEHAVDAGERLLDARGVRRRCHAAEPQRHTRRADAVAGVLERVDQLPDAGQPVRGQAYRGLLGREVDDGVVDAREILEGVGHVHDAGGAGHAGDG